MMREARVSDAGTATVPIALMPVCVRVEQGASATAEDDRLMEHDDVDDLLY